MFETLFGSRASVKGRPFSHVIPLLLLPVLTCFTVLAADDLVKPAFTSLPLGEVKPAGWLEGQLRIQANGLTGHLDEFWPDIRDSGWIGGNAEGWERLPYWLDGLIPLAYLLDDQDLVRKAGGVVNFILQHQGSEGWLGPEQSATGNYKRRDPWPVYVLFKALTQYYEASGDERVPLAMGRFLEDLDRQLNERPLFEWNRMRWQDGVLSVHWLFEKTGESWLLGLARKMEIQGYDWTAHFQNLPHKEKVQKWEHESHVVNNAMGVKAPAVRFRQSKNERDRTAAAESPSVLDRYHGQVTGIFSGDECLAGKMPSQGTETCAVVEYMFSLEQLLSVIGESHLADRLERIAFNALPAASKADMWARQYVQQANQPMVKISEDRIYTTNGPKANLYGLETNYGCCTANLHQGWPKFAANLWMRTPQGIVAVAYAPSSVQTTVSGSRIWIDLETDYPFEEKLRFTVRTENPVSFEILLRVPEWSAGPSLRFGEQVTPLQPGRFHSLERTWTGANSFELDLPMKTRVERRYNGSVSISRGPLVYSLRIGEKWVRVAGELPHADFEVYPKTPWNYGLQLDLDQPEESILFSSSVLSGNPFESGTTPVRVAVKGRRIPEWTLERNAAAPPPLSPVESGEGLETLTLIPYGAAKLRISEFPLLR